MHMNKLPTSQYPCVRLPILPTAIRYRRDRSCVPEEGAAGLFQAGFLLRSVPERGPRQPGLDAWHFRAWRPAMLRVPRPAVRPFLREAGMPAGVHFAYWFFPVQGLILNKSM